MARIIQIRDYGAAELAPYAHLNENQLKHYYEPAGGIFIAESPNAIIRALNAGYRPESLLIEEKYIETQAKEIIDRAGDIPVYVSSLEVLSQITGYHLTRGILCAFHRSVLPAAEEVLKGARRIAVLDNIENPTNVGAIIRNAAALSLDAVLLTPQTADPLYRRAIRVSVGTVFQIPWTYIGDLGTGREEDGARTLHRLGFQIASLALKEDTISIRDPRLKTCGKLALVLGNEGEGLPDQAIGASDYTVKIPMREGVDSLNVAAASSVAFWEISNV